MKYEFFLWVFLDRLLKTPRRAPSLRASKVLVSAPRNCSARSENGVRSVLEDVKLEHFYIETQANGMLAARGSMSFILKFL